MNDKEKAIEEKRKYFREYMREYRKNMETKLLTVEISESLRYALRVKASREGRTIKEVVNSLIELYVNDYSEFIDKED